MMKIVLAIPYNPLEEIGGLEISTLRLAASLRDLEQNVKILTKGESGFANDIKIEGQKDMVAICEWLANNSQQFDVVNWMEIFPESGEVDMQCLVSETLRQRGKKVFLTIATLGNLEKRAGKRHTKEIMRYVMDGYFAMTSGQLKEFSDYGIDKNVFPIGFGVDTNELYRPPTTGEKRYLRKKLGFPENAVLFLFIGRLVERKKPDFLLETWRGLPDIYDKSHLVMIGSGFGQHDSIEKKVAKIATGCSNLVRREMSFDLNPRDYYRACDVFVITSEREGMPNVIMEAMACGMPIITSEIPGIDELIENGFNGLIFPINDRRVLSQAIHEMASSGELRARLGTAARKTVVERRNALDIARQYVRIFETRRVGNNATENASVRD